MSYKDAVFDEQEEEEANKTIEQRMAEELENEGRIKLGLDSLGPEEWDQELDETLDSYVKQAK